MVRRHHEKLPNSAVAAQRQPSVKNNKALVLLDSGGLDYRPPLVDLGFVMRAESLRCLLVARQNSLARVSEPLAQLGIGQGICNSKIEFRDSPLGCAFRCPQAVPEGEIQARHPDFIHRRDIRRRRPACTARNGIGFNSSSPLVRQTCRRVETREVDVPGYQILIRGSTTAVRYELKASAGVILKGDAAHMRGAAGAYGPERRFVAIAH